jgi:hypothetical protein
MNSPTLFDLVQPGGFNNLFERNTAEFAGQPATRVYEITEKIYENVAGRRRYSSFDSFRNTRKKTFNR